MLRLRIPSEGFLLRHATNTRSRALNAFTYAFVRYEVNYLPAFDSSAIERIFRIKEVCLMAAEESTELHHAFMREALAMVATCCFSNVDPNANKISGTASLEE